MSPSKEDILSKDRGVQKRAFEQIYRYCYPKMMAFSGLRKSSQTEIDDLLQEAMMVVYQNLMNGNHESKAALTTYALAICKKMWLYKKRGDSRIRWTQINDDLLPVQEVKNIIHPTKIRNLLKELSPDCQELMKLVYFQSASMEEVATSFKLSSRQAAKNKKWRCIQRLIDIIKSHKLGKDDFYL